MTLYWSPEQIVQIVYFVVLAAGLTYLFRISKSGSDARRIAWFLLLFNWVPFMSVVAYTLKGILLISSAGPREAPLMMAIAVVSFPLMIVISLRAVYRLGSVFRPKEETFVSFLFGIPATAGTLVMILTLIDQISFVKGINISRLGSMNLLLVSIAWMFVVLVRKYVRARKTDASGRERRLIILFLIGMALPMFFQGSQAFSFMRLIPAEVVGAFGLIGMLSMSMALFLGVLLFGSDRHSIQAKLLGFLAAVVTMVFALSVSFSQTPLDYLIESQGAPDLRPLTISVDEDGGYTTKNAELAWISGGRLLSQLEDEWMGEYELPFEFPIKGTKYSSAWVGLNGVVSFGARLDIGAGWLIGVERLTEIPAVAPLYADFELADPAGGVRVHSTDSTFVVSWERVSRFAMPGLLNTFQAVLHPDGSVDFIYGDLVALPQNRIRGISSGEGYHLASFDDLPTSSDTYGSLLGELDDSEAYLNLMSHESAPLLWVGLIGLFFAGGIGYLFFRVGLVRQIEKVLTGLQHVEDGDLSVRVDVAERNELGRMADQFNTMTASLQRYSEDMESLVEERTTELKATQAQLVEQEKLASLGSLTAGIAHEIKNPLNFVNNFAEVGGEMADEALEAIDKGDSDELRSILAELKANSEQITKHGRRADDIVKAMMQHARGGSSERESIEVNTFLEEYANLAWHGMRAKDNDFQADLQRDYDPSVGTLEVMPQELGRVVLNLLNNAFDAVRGEEGARVMISSQRSANQVTISVSDNGPGIPEDIRQKIFEPFFTTKATGEGTGLGLSLSYDIVTKGHGGAMTVGESQEGGAQFTISLPVQA